MKKLAIFTLILSTILLVSCRSNSNAETTNDNTQAPGAVVSGNITTGADDTDTGDEDTTGEVVTDEVTTGGEESTTNNVVTEPSDSTETVQITAPEPEVEYYYGNDRYIAAGQEDTPAIRFIRWYKNDKRYGEPALICKANPDSEEFLFDPLVVSCGQMKCSVAIDGKYFALVVDENTDVPHLYYLNEGKELSLAGLNCSNISLCPIVKDDTIYLFTVTSTEQNGKAYNYTQNAVTFYSLGVKDGKVKKLDTFNVGDYVNLSDSAYVIKTTCHYYEQYTTFDNKSGTLELHDAQNANSGAVSVAYTIENGKVSLKKTEIH